MRLIVTLFVLLFTQLFLNLAHASPQTRVAADQKKSHVSEAKTDDRKKRKQPVKTSSKKVKSSPVKETAATKQKTTTEKKLKTTKVSRETSATHPVKVAKVTPPKKGYKKGYGRQRIKDKPEMELASNTRSKPLVLSPAHKKRYQHAKQTAMNKLMSQMGKPYRWGGTSPNTGFDCSGLIYYAYKDVVRIKMPRTANEMYHLRDAAPINRAELETGDLVFFRINNRGAADHVGVYLGNGKFIQSPRTGEEIRISFLDNDYWQDHYVGARRVVTPKTIR